MSTIRWSREDIERLQRIERSHKELLKVLRRIDDDGCAQLVVPDLSNIISKAAEL